MSRADIPMNQDLTPRLRGYCGKCEEHYDPHIFEHCPLCASELFLERYYPRTCLGIPVINNLGLITNPNCQQELKRETPCPIPLPTKN